MKYFFFSFEFVKELYSLQISRLFSTDFEFQCTALCSMLPVNLLFCIYSEKLLFGCRQIVRAMKCDIEQTRGLSVSLHVFLSTGKLL